MIPLKIKKIIASLRPKYWYQQNEYNKELDDWFLERLEKGLDISQVNRYTAKINGVEFWIANWPYASLSPYCYEKDYTGIKTRPSRYVIHEVSKHFEKLKLEQAKLEKDRYLLAQKELLEQSAHQGE